MKYIKQEAVIIKSIKFLNNEPFYDNADKDEIILPIIDSFPASDVAPVVHGQNVYYTHDGHCEFKCNVCGAYAGVVEGRTLDGGRFNYCPNCGARMLGGVNDAAN